ncbi:threonine synthase [Aerococcus agrisoli]|uniref:Threonine synthase n=1 Tax=Aerococcus agrisoli TaxID=2487350 RepID=A0A3N4G9L6_9LACT|nr:threonine synthase [Aerococcus agrisoli]RPA57266.1 threonine synthase [Aerococcus agrisoli]
MQFKSTRNADNIVTASQAIIQGLATDGGLYVPSTWPEIELDWDVLKDYSYQEMAYFVMSIFFDDFSEADLKACIDAAYDEKFDTDVIAPLAKVGDDYYLELFHGPTIAFKDLALQILPHLMKKSAEMNNNTNEIAILTATSGDTGKAAMAGFADVPGTKIIVFYPQGGVSSIQEKQMVTQKGDNTFVVAIEGNFDDAQTEVKNLFNDEALRAQLAAEGIQFSSANSMNIGRLIPQVVYYFYTYAQLVKFEEIQAGDALNFVVPTGNFGDILAGYYGKRLGLPVGKLVCASNDNTVLYDFFNTGVYDKNRPFKLTISPSMDILVSSNFERMLFHALGDDTDQLVALMSDLNTKGSYTFPASVSEHFADYIGEYADEDETKTEINRVFSNYDYLIDPHTGVASASLQKLKDKNALEGANVVVSTASPYKFPQAVLTAVGEDVTDYDDDALVAGIKQFNQGEYPNAINEIRDAEVSHNRVSTVTGMKDLVVNILLGDA